MDPTTRMGQLLELSSAIAEASDPDGVLEVTLPVLLELGGASAVLVLGPAPEGEGASRPVRADVGLRLEGAPVGDLEATRGELRAAAVPPQWQEAGIAQMAAQRLPDHLGTLLLAWQEPDVVAPVELQLALASLDAGLARVVSQESLTDLAARVDNAQQLANMGDYDWHIPTDTNTWSDQLFRIYGHPPRSFEPSYDRFLSLIHPDDQGWISQLHQKAYATGEPYAMIERIVRPSGEVRFLSSNGQVIMDADGTPVRMRGTCIDITERVHADEERNRIAARFEGLVDSSPDAILVLDEEQRIIQANQKAHAMLGGDPSGHGIAELLADWPGNASGEVRTTGFDGRELVLDVVTASVNQGEKEVDPFVAVFLRDARPRLQNEAMVARLSEAHLRRRQALEINDNVVQGLVAACYALDGEGPSAALTYLEQTLSAARAMMDDLLEPLHGEGFQPGDLVRTAPAVIGGEPSENTAPLEEKIVENRSHRVLVVDDAEDLRMLLRARMETRTGLTVVGEAADGLSAVELASELQPDLVMLDLAMPRMDGLEALPLIRAAVPGVRVIVLSGFNQNTLAEKAIAAGADRYVVKGGSMRQLLELVETVLDPAS